MYVCVYDVLVYVDIHYGVICGQMIEVHVSLHKGDNGGMCWTIGTPTMLKKYSLLMKGQSNP